MKDAQMTEPPKRPTPRLMWINHLALLAGDPSVTTSHNAVNSGVGGGLAALVVRSSTTGENAQGGGNKVVWRALEVPPQYSIVGLRICYELSGRSHISQVRLAQVQDPPASASVLLDDPTNHTAPGPICVDIKSPTIDPAKGALLFSVRVNFRRTADLIAIRAVALRLLPKP
jgi:hypothetical protein